ncbi:MAG TPA: hypothetical protein PKV66_06800 [Candidatus Pelethenecus sp.]|nr:hypothetical protein [Candidatus Pelethenecus sp.]
MPAKFDACVSGGGKVRTMKMKGNKYRHTCFIDGKMFMGNVKTKKSKKTKKK